MSEVLEQFDEQVSADLVKAAQEADLIDGGRYRFQIESYEGAVVDKEFFDEEGKNENPFYGKMVYNCRLSLTSVRDGKGKDAPFRTLERSRTIFQRVCFSNVLNRRGELSIESKLGGQLTGIMVQETGNSSVKASQVLEYFKDNAAEINITKTEGKVDEKTGNYYEPRNWVRGVKAIVG